MVEIIDGSLVALIYVALILLGLGRAFADEEQKKWAGFLALLGFVLFAAYRLHTNPPRTADELFERVTLRSLVFFFILLGVLLVLVPLICAFWKGLRAGFERTFEAPQRHLQPSRETVWDAPTASDKDLVEQRKRADLFQKEQDKRQKSDLRASIEILFQLHQHAIGARLDKATVMDWIARYMNDDQPLDGVKERHKEMRDLILSLVKQFDVPEPSGPSHDVTAARNDVEILYQKHPEIHEVCPPERLQAEIRVRIPNSASPEEAWKGARDMMKEILDLVAQEEQKKKQTKPAPINPPLGNI